jgi:hypothetical protein
MSPSNGDSTDVPTRDDDATPPADVDWSDRHARVEGRRSNRWVRADPPSDDWQARHSRTRRHD